MTTGFADVNGASLYYEVMGEGQELVLLHAGIADRRMWDGQFEELARDYRVVRYDRRGFGLSEMVDGPFSHPDDLRGLLDHLGIQAASFIGCSMGGAAAIDFVLSHPDRARALILVASAISGFEVEDAPPEEWEELVAADEGGDLERVSELEVRIWVDGPRRGPEAVSTSVRDLVREMNLIALQNEEAGLGEEQPVDPPAAGRLGEIRAPTLIIVGDLDQPGMLARADLLERGIPNVSKVVMSGTAHLPNMERPVEFSRVALGFLADAST